MKWPANNEERPKTQFITCELILSVKTMYTLLPQINPKNSEFPISENTSRPNNMPLEFLSEAVFAGGTLYLSLSFVDVWISYSIVVNWYMGIAAGIFWNLEAVFGRVDGVLKTAQANAEEPWKSLHIERRKTTILWHFISQLTKIVDYKRWEKKR